MLGYLSADIICSEKRTVFRGRSSRKTVSYEQQIMSKDKYRSIFSPQMETIVFLILQIFFATRAVLKIGEYSRIFPQFLLGNIRSRGAFRPIARKQKYLMGYTYSYNAIGQIARERTWILNSGNGVPIDCFCLGIERPSFWHLLDGNFMFFVALQLTINSSERPLPLFKSLFNGTAVSMGFFSWVCMWI